MSPRIFATGVTGYVGGDVLHALLQTHPSWESNITCLVRSQSRAASLSAAYPSIKLVFGTLEDTSILEDEAAKAEIVLHWASSDHIGAAAAIKNGLESGRGGYWIHTSGTDILLHPKLLEGRREIEDDVSTTGVKLYDDWDGIKEVVSIPDNHSHRLCDKVPLSISSQNIKTAIVCPPTIWGRGRGTGSTRSHQIYALAKLTLDRGSRIHIHASTSAKTFWPNIHIFDLTRLYLKLIDAAASELRNEGSTATWGQEGYYFAENGTHYWQDVTEWLAEEVETQGYLKNADVLVAGSGDQRLTELAGSAVWNLRASCKAIRARRLFRWEPSEHPLKYEITEIVRSEAHRAGMTNATGETQGNKE